MAAGAVEVRANTRHFDELHASAHATHASEIDPRRPQPYSPVAADGQLHLADSRHAGARRSDGNRSIN